MSRGKAKEVSKRGNSLKKQNSSVRSKAWAWEMCSIRMGVRCRCAWDSGGTVVVCVGRYVCVYIVGLVAI